MEQWHMKARYTGTLGGAMTTKTATTKHTCNDGFGPSFGRKTAGCPRCDELLAGAAPVVWAGTRRRQFEAQELRSISAHFASDKHRSGGCGPVCTFGDW